MQQLLGDKLGTADANSFPRELFLQRLPANVRMVLASADASMELDKLADMADKVMEVATPTIAAVTEPQPNPPPNTSDPSDIQQLKEEVAHLTARIEALTTRSRRRSNSRPHCNASPNPEDSLC